MKYIIKKSVSKIPPKSGSIFNTTNITNKDENTYSASIIETLLGISGTDLTALVNLFFPIGSEYVTQEDINPATILGVGTWVRAKGLWLVGLDEDDENFNEIGKTGGSKTHSHTQADKTGSTTLTASQSGLPAHGHSFNGGGNAVAVYTDTSIAGGEGFGHGGSTTWWQGANINIVGIKNNTAEKAKESHTHTLSPTDEANSLPPYHVVGYKWLRIA